MTGEQSVDGGHRRTQRHDLVGVCPHAGWVDEAGAETEGARIESFLNQG